MTPQEVKELARATCCWLSYKHLTGFQGMLSEAALSVPVSELLTSRTSWLVEPELHYPKLLGGEGLPEFWCDFAGRRKGGNGEVQFVLEAKYLKNKAESMRQYIAADFIRLALPVRKTLKRYFLLAGRSKCFEVTNAKFLFERELFTMVLGKGCYIQVKQELLKPYLAKLAAGLHEHSKKKGKFVVPDSVYVTCRAIEQSPGEGDDKYTVMVWSIGMTNEGNLATSQM